MQTENSDEFYDISIRNKKFGRVDANNGIKLIEKYVFFFFYLLGGLGIRWGLRRGVEDLTDNVGVLRLILYDRLTHSVQSPTRTEQLANFSSRFRRG